MRYNLFSRISAVRCVICILLIPCCTSATDQPEFKSSVTVFNMSESERDVAERRTFQDGDRLYAFRLWAYYNFSEDDRKYAHILLYRAAQLGHFGASYNLGAIKLYGKESEVFSHEACFGSQFSNRTSAAKEYCRYQYERFHGKKGELGSLPAIPSLEAPVPRIELHYYVITNTIGVTTNEPPPFGMPYCLCFPRNSGGKVEEIILMSQEWFDRQGYRSSLEKVFLWADAERLPALIVSVGGIGQHFSDDYKIDSIWGEMIVRDVFRKYTSGRTLPVRLIGKDLDVMARDRQRFQSVFLKVIADRDLFKSYDFRDSARE